jgi:hypothetical protein
MANLMRFLANLQRRIRFNNPEEPTIPGPVADDAKRLYSGYAVPGGVANNPATFNDTNAFFVNSITGNDANPGTQASPKATIQAAVNLVGAIGKRTVVVTGSFRERITPPVNPLVNIIAASGQTPIILAPDTYPTPQVDNAAVDGFFMQYGQGYRGDYRNNALGELEYCLPNAGWNPLYATARSKRVQLGRIVASNGVNTPTGFSQIVVIADPYRPYRVITLIGNNFGDTPAPAAVQPVSYRFNGGIVGERTIQFARYDNLRWSDATGNYAAWGTSLVQVPGTNGGSTHYLGTNYAGFTVGLARHSDGIYAITTSVQSVETGTSRPPIPSTERITLWKYDHVALTWNIVLEWPPSGQATLVVDGPGVVGNAETDPNWTPALRYKNGTFWAVQNSDDTNRADIKINYNNCCLISAGQYLYWNQPRMGTGVGRFPHPDGSGDLFVLDPVAGTRTAIKIAGRERIDDVVFWRNQYYATSAGRIFRSSNGLTNWQQVHAGASYYCNRLAVIHNVLFCSTISPQTSMQYLHTHNGTLWHVNPVGTISGRDTIPGGLIFESNGRVCITHVINNTSGGLLPPVPAGLQHLMLHFQESILNFERYTAAYDYGVENIEIDGRDTNGNIAVGDGVTEGRGIGAAI